MTKQKNSSSEKGRSVPELRFPEFNIDWETKMLKNVATFSKGKGISKSEISENGSTECIMYGQLYTHYNEVINDIKSKTDISKSELILSESNDIIIPASGESQIDIAKASCVTKSGVALGGDLNIIKTKNNGVFISYYLNSKKKLDIAKLAQGISVVHLYTSQLSLLNLNLPSLPEQQKIASFLTAVDDKLQTLKKKKELLEQYKKGVMQKIFSQEIRFKITNQDGELVEPPEWEKKKLRKVIVQFKENSTLEDQYKVLTSSNKGLMLQTEYYGDNRLTERENIGFNIIPEGYITYRSRSDNRKFTFNINSLGFKGIISTYYPVFKSIDGDERFIVELLNYYQHKIGRYSVGTSQTVLSFNDLCSIKMNIPSKKEQTKIANFLSAIDEKIKGVAELVEATEQWKKGLLQKMFV